MTVSRIGLLGGTFDPVHNAHLQLAEASLRECVLDRILFIPSASPPHKVGAPITPFAHRLAMLELVSKRNPRFACSGVEGDLPSPSYTIDTLHTLGGMFPEGTEFFFIVGIDAFLDFPSWKSYRDILRLVDIVIALRHGYTMDRLTNFLQSIGYFWQDNYWRVKDGKQRIFLLQTIPARFSSTSIRKSITEGFLPVEEIPEEVLEYIVKHQLYRADAVRDRSETAPPR